MRKLRGKSAQGVMAEINDLESSMNQNTKKVSFSDLWATKGNVRALILACGLVALQQLSGINVVLFYMESIFNRAGTGLSPSLSTIIIGIVQVLASSVTPLVVDRLGRRFLLILSALGMTLALVFSKISIFNLLRHKKSKSIYFRRCWDCSSFLTPTKAR
jgi:hypothetical protein